MPKRTATRSGFRTRRAQDKKRLLELQGDDVWIHLNYQLVHLLDFLPTTNWGVQKSQPLWDSWPEQPGI